ncbi:hypothetical protein BCT55_15215 [Vibrio splendidus]|uniref:hypothetical protein n=1 Tax=Vibrio splendidus TaxID=29497 RepID=UPI000CA87446|nr:hypothetical protein [Vibrio splendidus]PMM35401.1 hypothetical protein BCT55_15215 [Vibrio splendidus]
METIYTIDAREHCMLEVMADYFQMTHESIYLEINRMFHELIGTLKDKSVNYQELRNCLTPSIDKKEVILVFDSLQIDSSWYGGEVFEKIIPLLDRRTSHSFLCGDYIDHGLSQDVLYSELVASIKAVNPSEYKHGSQYFLVYINNVSENFIETLNNGLGNYKPYTGYIDVTFSGFMKNYASTTLVRSFIKHKNFIICGHEDDREHSENVNMSGYAFEENGYRCISVQDSLYGVFLSYKVERRVYDGFKRDTDFSINSITSNVLAIDNFDVEIDERKLTYLKENKTGRMKKSELIHFDKQELEALIRSKISDNYIYNLTYLKEHDITKFNILIEKQVDNQLPVRMMVSLEYIPSMHKLRLITMV